MCVLHMNRLGLNHNMPSNIRGCQSGSTWSAGQEKIRETCTKFQREHKNRNTIQRNDQAKEGGKKEVNTVP